MCCVVHMHRSCLLSFLIHQNSEVSTLLSITGADPGMKKRGGTLLLVVEGSARSAQTRGVWGHAPPRKILKLRPSEMDSKVI